MPKKVIPETSPYKVTAWFLAILKFLPSSIYSLLSTFFVIVLFSSSILTLAIVSTPSISTKLENFLTRFAPVSKYKLELFFNFNSSILLKVNNTSENSLVLSLAPSNMI